MEKAALLKKLNDCNTVAKKIQHSYKMKDIAIYTAWTVHFLMYIPFFANMFAASGDNSQYPVIERLGSFYPNFNTSIPLFLLSAFISLFVIPIMLGALVIIVGAFFRPKTEKLDEGSLKVEEADRLLKELDTKYDSAIVHWIIGDWIYSAVLSVALVIIGFNFNPDWVTMEFDYKKILLLIGLAILAFLFFSGIILHVGTFFTVFKKLLEIRSPLLAAATKKARQNGEFVKTTLKNEQKEAEIKRKAKAKRKAAERLKRLAIEAEEKWKSLENPEENMQLAKKLADEGSASACAFVGRKMYDDFSGNAHTKAEKKWMARDIKKYLSVSASAGDSYAHFLLLSVAVQTESNDAAGWRELLINARSIKKFGNLSEEDKEFCDVLIATIVETIDRADKLAEKPKREPKKYCRFYDHGVCRFHPNTYSVAKCEYVDDPGKCCIALAEKSIVYE